MLSETLKQNNEFIEGTAQQLAFLLVSTFDEVNITNKTLKKDGRSRKLQSNPKEDK